MIKFVSCISEINLIVVSEKIITKKPIMNVRYLTFVKFVFSFEDVSNKNGIRLNNGI